jgi:hypothetical protein
MFLILCCSVYRFRQNLVQLDFIISLYLHILQVVVCHVDTAYSLSMKDGGGLLLIACVLLIFITGK